jgi:hypothetical protein
MTEPIRGAGQPSWPLSPYNIQVSYGASQSGASGTVSGGIARGTGADWFGPLNPLSPIAPPDVAGRRFDFPPGFNLVTRPRAYEPIGFAELRGFADAYDIIRLVIETRKDPDGAPALARSPARREGQAPQRCDRSADQRADRGDQSARSTAPRLSFAL